MDNCTKKWTQQNSTNILSWLFQIDSNSVLLILTKSNKIKVYHNELILKNIHNYKNQILNKIIN